jgi:arsenite methyltransferase
LLDQTATAADHERIHDEVRARYAEAALAASTQRSDSHAQTSCCGPAGTAVFGEILYAAEDRAKLPEAAILASLGCGNPTAVAELRPGERVLDLGSGGGIDVILSARRVGPTGRAIGLDMTDEMLALAVRNAAEAGVDNVEFVRGTIESIPLPAASIDVVISNCVINLAADKAAVFAEIARVLRPGGRVGVSDVVADDSLSPAERAERGSYSGCIAGALSFAEYRAGLAAVGLVDVSIEPTHAVGDGLHGAIIKATRPLEAVAEPSPMPALPRAVAMLDASAAGCGCGSEGCC